jgi:serine/threonine-protein kinase
VLGGKYRVERVLGAGGMGVVVAARHLQLDSRVAIKLLLPGMLGNQQAVVRFAREAKAAAKITSENVARVLDVGALDDGAPYMVMEFLEGGDLAAWLQERGPLPAEQAIDFLLQACIAIAEAHKLGIVHRDLKPSNLFCVRRADGQLGIKVLDFGISKMNDLGVSSGGMSVTKTTALMGTPLYMSPEQMQSAKTVTPQGDLWALGIILFELLVGKVPFEGETLTEVAVKVAMQPPPPLRAFRPDLPVGLEAAILKCLEKDPRSRFGTVAELAYALAPFGSRGAPELAGRVGAIAQGDGRAGSWAPQGPSAPPYAAVSSLPASAPGGTLTFFPVGVTHAERTGRRALRVSLASVAVLGVAGAVGFVLLQRAQHPGGGRTPDGPSGATAASAMVSASSSPTVIGVAYDAGVAESLPVEAGSREASAAGASPASAATPAPVVATPSKVPEPRSAPSPQRPIAPAAPSPAPAKPSPPSRPNAYDHM